MRILVCIKQVPQTNKAEVDPVTGVLRRDGADAKMNPYDLYALEAAVRLKERRGGSVTALTMGPPQAERVIREAFAMGADAGVLITDRRFAGADVFATGYTLYRGIQKLGAFDLILCGKQTTDGDTAQVGPELSEWLGIPCAANVSDIESDESGVTVKADLPGEVETLSLPFPCLISVEKDIHVPRLPSYLLRQKSAGWEIKRFTLDDFDDRDPAHYGLDGSPTQVRRIFPPETSIRRELWRGGGEQLAERIFERLRLEKVL